MNTASLNKRDVRILNEVFLNRVLTKYNHIKTRKRYTWTDFYKSEEELLDDIKNINLNNTNIMNQVNQYMPTEAFIGEDFCWSISRILKNNIELTMEQLKECKRLAPEIKKISILNKMIIDYIDNNGEMGKF
ncbi:MAG: hypothetical protein IJ086_07405 [Clostridium sp.]|nr:hypothetical protein [Clostridium sp.]MBQ8998495.1 hypothetical protein [Clostridium sp.]